MVASPVAVLQQDTDGMQLPASAKISMNALKTYAQPPLLALTLMVLTLAHVLTVIQIRHNDKLFICYFSHLVTKIMCKNKKPRLRRNTNAKRT